MTASKKPAASTRTRAKKSSTAAAKQPPKVAPGAQHATTPAPANVAPTAAGETTGRKAGVNYSDLGGSTQAQERQYAEARNARCPDCGASADVPAHGPGCTQVG